MRSALPPEADITRRPFDVRYGSWPCQNVLPEEVGLGEVVTEANFPDLDYARIAAISG